MMNRNSLVFRTLFYYWQANLAVLLGVAVATAVIAGALIVGDSVRSSLKQMTLDRLAKVDYAVSGNRFFREKLATEFENASPQTTVAPAIFLTGTLQFQKENESKVDELSVAGRVHLIGCDHKLWGLLHGEKSELPDQDAIVLNERVADQLGVEVGNKISLFVNLPSTIPQESLLGKRDVDELTVEIPVTVSAIVKSQTTLGRFSLQPNQQLPLNAYVNLDRLQSELDLHQQSISRRNTTAKPARVNTLLISENMPTDRATAALSEKELTSRPTAVLQKLLTLDDLYLRVVKSDRFDYFSLESERMVLEKTISETAIRSAKEVNAENSPVLVYLVNEIANADDPKKFSMYSVAAGLDLSVGSSFVLKNESEESPFGSFLDEEGKPVKPLANGDVAINDWLAKDLGVSVGDEVIVKYHVVGSRGDLPEIEKRFHVATILKMEGTSANDPGLTPFVEGITDAETFADWSQPFPMEMSRITSRDEEYWEKHKASPKLFLNLEEAKTLWQSRYGDSTSVRIGNKKKQAREQTVDKFGKRFLEELSGSQLGLTVLPVKFQGLQAAAGATNFSGLFIGFSFFVIAAAIVLIALLFRLGIETRVKQIGLFSAVGFSAWKINKILLMEGFLVAVAGTAAGLFLAVAYARVMIYGLKTWWVGAIGTTFLEVNIEPISLVAGAIISLVVAVPGMWLGIWQMLKISPKDRLHGVMIASNSVDHQKKKSQKTFWLGFLFLDISIFAVLGVILKITPTSEAFGGFNWQIVSFFVAGISGLTGSLLLFSFFLRRKKQPSDQKQLLGKRGVAAGVNLGIRNTSRNVQRSQVTVAMVAFATFVVVAVAAGKQNPTHNVPDFHSGNGGFSLVAESARPLLYDLTSEEGQKQFGLNATEDQSIRDLLSETKIVSFRVREGEDASCLNLYQTKLPTILAVSEEMIQRGGFLFADTPGKNPWELLHKKTKDGNIPVIGDMNTLQYSLHKPIESTIELPDELGQSDSLEVVGSLGGSVFQGVLLMSEEHFLKLFPEVSGFNYFLIECDPELNEKISRILETRLVTLGFDVEPIGKRLDNFLAVQNTYLSTFQALGGLGLLLGTFGLATVMLRNVLERQSELALMRAIGFRKKMLAIMVLAENAWLLLLGLCIGTVCAFVAMAPQILGRGADVPWLSGSLLLLSVFFTGMLAATIAVIEAIRTPILATLRRE